MSSRRLSRRGGNHVTWKRIRQLEKDLEFMVQALKESADNCKHWRTVNSAERIEGLEREVKRLSIFQEQSNVQAALAQAAAQAQSQWPFYSQLGGLFAQSRPPAPPNPWRYMR